MYDFYFNTKKEIQKNPENFLLFVKNYNNNNLNQAFNVSDTVNNFMDVKRNNPLLKENTNNNRNLIEKKIQNLQ
mgnify:CR=1 FL=1